MWVRCNPNPKGKEVGDCVIRAISIALHLSWHEVFDDLCALASEECDMPNADAVWGKYLYQQGFEPFLLPNACPACVTVREFTRRFPKGTYIIGTGDHAVCVIDGSFYDSWDSGQQTASFFWRI